MMKSKDPNSEQMPTQATDELTAATAVVDQCRQKLGGDSESITALAEALEARADLFLRTGEPALACDDFKEAVELIQSSNDCYKQLGRLHFGLGMAYNALNEPGHTATHWERAIECFEQTQPPSLIAAASIANNLGFLKRNDDDFDAAETAFLKALEIFHTHCGPEDSQTATVADNLGSLYHFTGYYESAREMYRLAMEACRKSFGDAHPETARACHKLGIALVATDDRSGARRFFEKAFEVFEKKGADHHDDLLGVAEDFRSLLQDENDIVMAETISQRVRKHAASNGNQS